MISESSRQLCCGRCGGALSGYAPEGLCAACLLESAFEEGDPSPEQSLDSGCLFSFGDYQLRSEIARGGMGVVYRAHQASLNRTVAVKMILAGRFASPTEIARFQTEAETAARLQHPGIVAIHEIGEHEGCHWFAMDYVAGPTITELVRDQPLPAKRAARYVREIAEAIHYAHCQGVLHRDLKPSNVLIDAEDHPRVTDFGLAKWLEGKSDLTLTGQVLGSPSFMPPEQAGGKERKIGPWSDIYSLGAILYYLLTGRPPFVAETPTATLRMVTEVDPVPPRLLNASVPRDLETICLRCLEKDPQRRFPTARDLAEELNRFLSDEPIRARPVHRLEKGWRWCRRNPALAATGGAALLLLLTLAIGSPIAVVHISRERQQAQREFRKSQESTLFLKQMLEAAGPSVARGYDTRLLRDILDQTAQRIENGALKDYPEVEADLRITLGQVYSDLGLQTSALAMNQEGLRLTRLLLGPTNHEVATALANIGAAFCELERFPEAVQAGREALSMRIQLTGEMDTNVAMSLNNIGVALWNLNQQDESERVQLRALQIRRKLLPPDDPLIAMSLLNLGNARGARGDLAGAETNYLAALEICEKTTGNSPLAGALYNNLGVAQSRRGALDAATATHRKALEVRKEFYRQDHVFVVFSLTQLGTVLASTGDLNNAQTNLNEAVAMLRRMGWLTNSAMADALAGLGTVLTKRGDWAAAETLHQQALAMRTISSAGENADMADSLEALGLLAIARHDLPGAQAKFQQAAEIARRTQGEDYPAIIAPLSHLAWISRQLGDEIAARARAGQALALSARQGPYGAWRLLQANQDLAEVLRLTGKAAEAEALLSNRAVPVEAKTTDEHR